MSPEIIAITVGLIILWLLLTWAFKVLKVSISTIVMIGIVLLIIRVVFGVQIQQLWQELILFIQNFSNN